MKKTVWTAVLWLLMLGLLAGGLSGCWSLLDDDDDYEYESNPDQDDDSDDAGSFNRSAPGHRSSPPRKLHGPG